MIQPIIRQATLMMAPMAISLFITLPTYATAFLPQEPRALAMGGASVAASNSTQAHYYNPALLINTSSEENFNFAIDSALRGSDSDQLIDAMVNFNENNIFIEFAKTLNKFRITINGLNPNNNTISQINALSVIKNDLAKFSNALRQGIIDISGKSLALDINLGFFASMPNYSTAWTLYYNTWGNTSVQGILSDNDIQIMASLIDLLNIDLTPKTSEQAQTNAEELTKINADLAALNPADNLTTAIHLKGAIIQEFGLTLARHYSIKNQTVSIGLTPKLILVSTFEYVRTLRELDQERFFNQGQFFNQERFFNQENIKEYTSVNFDIALAKKLRANWKLGLIIKNLIPQTFDTSSGGEVKLSPAIRIGTSYHPKPWATLAADFDITNNQDIASFSESRFLSFGVEADMRFIQLRAGYRFNLSSIGGNIPSIGLGLSLFGLNIDAAVAGATKNATIKKRTDLSELDDINASLRIGIRW